MEEHGLHRSFELRLEALAARIASLRQKMAAAKGPEKLEEHAEIDELERRYKTLAEQLQALNREGSGFRQNVKSELEQAADDLSSAVEDFTSWVDSGYRGQRPVIRGSRT
jgi:predicted  nucleic acid-binding Zn-ribbon protein